MLGGLGVVVMGIAVNFMHSRFFGLPSGERLSAITAIEPLHALVPAAGGIILGFTFLLQSRWRPESPVDPIEANALRGGRMSIRDSLIVAAQTVLSSGVGASVGLEAGYSQLGSGAASWVGRMFHLRRNDLRLLVGCGAAAAIAGAFASPLGGAFYAFELIIGSYSAGSLAPVGIAALNGYIVTQYFAPVSLGIVAGTLNTLTLRDLIIASILGVAAGLFGIALMRCVALWERLMTSLRIPASIRPAIGGLLVGAFALLTPQVLSSGHGALHVTAMLQMPLTAVGSLLLFKSAASVVSLGSGFRGGLFFASLLLGALGGRLFAAELNGIWPALHLDADIYAILGLGALTASVIGAPLAVTFIVLENTGDFWLAATVLIAVIIANLLTRELFGYSFATWRFHLRGETIRSAADVGWIRDLTVGRMMRPDIKTVAKDTPIEVFKQRLSARLGDARGGGRRARHLRRHRHRGRRLRRARRKNAHHRAAAARHRHRADDADEHPGGGPRVRAHRGRSPRRRRSAAPGGRVADRGLRAAPLCRRVRAPAPGDSRRGLAAYASTTT